MPRHGHEVTDDLFKMHAILEELKHRVVRLLMQSKQEVQGNRVPLESMVDIAYLCDRISKEADQVKKEVNAAKQLVDNVACAAWMIQTATDPEAPKSVTGHLAVGNPNLNATADVPDRSSPAYTSLMKWLGADDGIIEQDVLRPHWPHLMDLVTAATAEGRPLPPGLDPKSLRTRYALQQLRLKKGVSI